MKAKNDKIELFSISGRSDSTLNDLSRSLEDSDEFNRSMKRRIYKNLIAFSVSFLLYSSSNSGLHALQSSLNSVNNLGLISLLSSSAASSISSFFLPVIGFKLLGFKWTAIVAQFFSISYIIANYFPGYFTLTSASIIHGVSNITLWALHGSLIAALAKQYSNYSTRKPELILVKFFAISSAISHLNHIISSGISAAVLNQNGLGFGHDHDLMENYSNSSIGKVCGARSCPSTASSIEAPPKLQILQMVVIYIVLAILGVVTLLVFMDNIKPTVEDIDTIKDSLHKSVKLMSNRKMWLLFPIFILIANLMSFVAVDFARYYISCGYTIRVLGIFAFIFGISSMTFSVLIHQLAKFVNTTTIIISVVISLIAVMIYLLFWTIQTNVLVVYGLGAYFGLVESTWGTFLHAIIGVVFYEQQTAAFTTFRFIVSTFLLVTLITSTFLCSYIKIYIILVLAIPSFYSPLLLEFVLRYEKRRNDEKDSLTTIKSSTSRFDDFLAKFL